MKATSSWLAAASLSSWALRPLPFPPWQVLRGQRGGGHLPAVLGDDRHTLPDPRPRRLLVLVTALVCGCYDLPRFEVKVSPSFLWCEIQP